MRLFSSLYVLLLALLGVVSSRSAVGNRLLVVLEDESQKGLYSKFWADLEGMLQNLAECALTDQCYDSSRFPIVLRVTPK
jgi:hypothetical protein